MRLFITIIFFITIPEFGISQITLGLRINNIFHISSTETGQNEEFEYVFDDEFKVNSVSAGILTSFRSNKSIYSCRFEYSRSKETRLLSELRAGTEDISVRSNTLYLYTIAMSIERIINIDKVDFYYGLGLVPFEFRPSFKRIIGSDIVDNTNTLLGRIDYITHHPQAYYARINLPLRIYHNFGRFGIGLELINGLRFQKPGKTTKQEVRQYDATGELIETSWDEKQDNRFEIQKMSTFSIGFQYKFGDREKLKK